MSHPYLLQTVLDHNSVVLQTPIKNNSEPCSIKITNDQNIPSPF